MSKGNQHPPIELKNWCADEWHEREPVSVVDSIRQPLLVLDEKLLVSFANVAFLRRFGVTREQTIGHDLFAAGGRCLDVPELRTFVAQIESGQSVVEDHEIELVVPGLGKYVLVLTATRIRGKLGSPTSVLVAIDDITERRHREAESRSARWRAERARLRQSRFLAAASHDLRQPLQALSLLRSILLRNLKQGKVAEAARLVTQLNETADSMGGVLDTLLDINQLEEGVIQAEKCAFPIDGLLEKLGSEFEHHAEAKGLRWRMVSSKSGVWSDPHLLEQILRNLLSNAIKYTKSGSVLLGCRRNGDNLRIEVWDSGVGIPKSQIPEIFRLFERVEDASQDGHRDTGLGLAIVRRLSDLLGHIVYVHSLAGSGSVFAIEVPLARNTRVIQSARQPANVVNIRDSVPTILIVEADPAVRDLLERLFVSEGYRALSASDEEQARTFALGPQQPDVIVAGYQFPIGRDGLQIIACIRECLGRRIPAVVLTGHISIDTMRQISAQGCVQRTKPTEADDLCALVRSLYLTPHCEVRPRSFASQTELSAQEARRPTIYVVDDDSSFRAAMRTLISDERGWSTETYSSAEAFLEAFLPQREGVLLIGAQLPGMTGVDVLERFHLEGQQLPVIVLSADADIRLAVRAMKAGAAAFLEKPVQFDELVGAIELALDRYRSLAARIAWHNSVASRIAKLTIREHQVMELVLEGKANKLIAHALGISQRTVETHRATVMKKTGARSLSELVHLTIAGAATSSIPNRKTLQLGQMNA